MPFSPSDSRLFAPLFGDPEMGALFSDDAAVRAMLRVEGALARAQAGLALIPAAAADAIARASESLAVDEERLRAGVQNDGFPVAELVRQLQSQAGAAAAPFVHWGATTQDIMDTALVLTVRAALALLEARQRRLALALAALAARHRGTLLAGRTHSQQALPITFGLKAAGWLAPLLRHQARLAELRARVLVVQCGGAVGTMAAWGDDGPRVQAALARELSLGVPLLPWHAQRDGCAELAGWLSLLTGSLAKMAQDVILLAQTEVGELRESGDAARGGSSTMPQKSNPIVCELVIAAARANASLLAAMHHALIQEHERGTGGWQLEWLTLPQMFAHAASALRHAVYLAEGMQVDAERMASNVRASNGLMLAEPLSFALARHMPRAQAKQLVAEACRVALAEHRHLVDVLRARTPAPLDWPALRDEAGYLGSAGPLVDGVLREAAILYPSPEVHDASLSQ